MRLSELYFKLAKNRESLTLLYMLNKSNSKYEVSNLNTVNQLLHELKQYDVFLPDIKRLEDNPTFGISYSPAFIDTNSFQTYMQVLVSIRAKLDMLEYLYSVTGKRLEDKTLCFSIPENYDLKDLRDFSNNITKSLSQISTIPEFEGEITFKGVESGSDWFYFVISSAKLLLIVEIIIRIAKKVVIESAIAYNTVRLMKLQTDSIANLENMQKALIKNYIENEENFKNLNTEKLNTVVNATVLLSKEISKGTKAEISLLNQAKSEEVILTDKTLESTIEKIKLLQEASQSQEPTENNAADKNSDHNAE